jgi:hypothetical protein
VADVDVRQWRLFGRGSELLNRAGVTLRNAYAEASVRYGEREHGINLVWDGAADLANVSLHRAGGANGPLTFGEHLAVEIDGGGFLRYQEREYGINLVWSESPVHQWEVTGGVFGRAVPLTESVSLFNRRHGDHIVYGKRRYGINLRWWADLENYGDYPPLPIRPELRGQSGEPGQIVLTGSASKIEVFHGGTDDELDWHVYIRLDSAVRDDLLSHLLAHATGAKTANRPGGPYGQALPLRSEDLDLVYSELMVVDGYDNLSTDEKWFSADLTRILLLNVAAWDVSAEAAEEQGLSGATAGATDESRLCRRNARVSLQGAFVNDSEYGFKVEIHPLDSLAYALDAQGIPLSIGPEDREWPAREVTWRVAAFTNSTFHRINKADYLKKERVTTWYLPLPREAAGPLPSESAGRLPGEDSGPFLGGVDVAVSFPGFTNEARGRGGMDELRPTEDDRYQDYRLRAESHAIERDYRTGERRLRVTVSMRTPDRWGGMFLADYTLRARRNVVK